MSSTFAVTSPVDGSTFLERSYASEERIEATLSGAYAAFEDWRCSPLTTRIAMVSAGVDALTAQTPKLAEELTWQMGRPISQSPGEIRGFAERARTMIELAEPTLANINTSDKIGFERFIVREPLGVVLSIAAWNYPYLIAVNSVIPALIAGNTVILKHSDQTALVAERIAEAFETAGLPKGVFQVLHMTHEDTARVVADPRVAFVSFTGSVSGGRAVHQAAAGHFKAVGLELGGKDPAYVRSDADLAYSVENLIDGAFFNSGQSCCGIERIYVHHTLFSDFVGDFVAKARRYQLGDPTEPSTNLGPLVRSRSADAVRSHIASAVAMGAQAHIDEADFPISRPGTPYLAPQVLTNVHHGMDVMREETFGPVVGIMAVEDDDEALNLMNDSPYGLTASIWTRDANAALSLGKNIDTGTVFMNRCDALDPSLAWVGVKQSGRGCTLSRVGYEHLTRPKSFHLKIATG
jgi:acyl-CoA reductase-like NAD-dependent aldehyde dehydrogenase